VKLADTCVWIELISNTATGRRYKFLFEDSAQLIVPTLVQYELNRWALREAGEQAAFLLIAATRDAQIVPLDYRFGP
jgi:predicted nucleic acid-binding protein